MGGGGGMKDTGSKTVELPDWMQDRYKEVFGKEDALYDTAKGIAEGMDPRDILGPSEMEKMGLGEAMKGFETGEWFLDQAGDFSGIDAALGGMYDNVGKYDDMYNEAGELGDYTSERIGDKTLDEMRESYESQYTDDIVDTTLANADRQRARERLAAQAATTAAGGTSNTRGAISQALGDQLFGMNRAQTEAQLRDDAFRTAAEFGQSEAALGQKEDQMNYDFASDALDLQRGITDSGQGAWGDILSGEESRRKGLEGLSGLWQTLGTSKGGVLSSFGEMARGLEQAQMDADRTHDMDMANWLSGILGQNKTLDSGVGGTTTQSEATPGFGQQLLGMGMTALGGWLSDEEAKQDITDAEGGALDQIVTLDVKEYSYKDDAPGHRKDRHKGLIAQDVETKIPGSTYEGADGLKRIDPFTVAATIVQAMDELDAKQRPQRKWKRNSGLAA